MSECIDSAQSRHESQHFVSLSLPWEWGPRQRLPGWVEGILYDQASFNLQGRQ